MSSEPEPLEESAPLARKLATECCRVDPLTGESCAWYHGLWQTLRIMRLVETPEYHAAFFRDAFRAIGAGGSAPRVLVSGSADYGMLAQVFSAFRGAGIEPEVTVIDRCDTPLALNRWYAERRDAVLETSCCDVLEFECAQPFDAICTHAFFGRFSPSERVALLTKWRSLLRPGGAVVTATPIRPGNDAPMAGFAPDQILAFRAAVEELAQRAGDTVFPEPCQLAQAAETYARRHQVHPVRSLEELRVQFEGAGFRLNDLSRVPATSTAPYRISGPTVVGCADYARIVAIRT